MYRLNVESSESAPTVVDLNNVKLKIVNFADVSVLNNFDYIPIIDIDADTNESLCDKYDIKVLPTLILIDNEGNEVIKHIGFINKFDLINLIKDNNYA